MATRNEQTYDERHARGLAERGLDEAGYQSLVDSFGLVGAWAVDHVDGEVWAQLSLCSRDRVLAALAAIAAQGGQGSLRLLAHRALAEGITPGELDEVLGIVMGYAGLARATDAYDVLAQVAGLRWPADREPAPKDDAERLRDALDVMTTIGGGRAPQTPEAGLDYLENKYGLVGGSVYRWIFGEMWSRSGLSRRDRSLVIIAVLISTGALHELNVHAPAGEHHGLSRAEIDELIIAVYPYLGAPRAVDGIRYIQRVWADRDAAASA